MHPSSRGIFSVVVAVACACAGGQSGTESNGGTAEGTGGRSESGVGGGAGADEGTGGQSTVGVGGGSGEGTGGQSTVGGDDRCVVVATTPVGWLDETELGTSEAVFGAVSGTCQAPFIWDGSGWGDTITVTPASGESTVTVTVEVDETSARSVEQAPAPSVSPMEGMICDHPWLEVDAMVTLALADGTSWQMPAKAVITAGWQTPWIEAADLDPADVSEWVSIVPADGVSATVSLTMAPLADGCVGQIVLMEQSPDGSMATTASSAFASWSDTGCALGEQAVDLSEPLGEIDLAAEVNATFGQRELPGEWEDGGATTLSLRTTITATHACGYPGYAEGAISSVEIPVQVIASTADERLVGLDTPGTVRAAMDTDGTLASLDLGTGTVLMCGTATDVLPYRTADCAEVQSVEVGLHFNGYRNNSAPSGGNLDFYVTLRNSTAPPGAADRVDRLVLEP